MKKYIMKIGSLFVVASMLFFNGCDELNNIPLNIPLNPIYFSSTTGANEYSSFDDGSVCLSASDDWNENVEDVKSVKFVSASLWTEATTTSDLTGDVQLTLYEGFSSGGTEIFVWTVQGLATSDYVDNPLEIELTEVQKEALNAYLDSFKDNNDLCFYASFTSSNLTGQGPPFTISARVQFVVEAEVEL